MISEVDVRDFKSLNVKLARQKLDKAVGDPDIMTYSQYEAIAFLEEFFKRLEAAQNQTMKQVPALFKRNKG